MKVSKIAEDGKKVVMTEEPLAELRNYLQTLPSGLVEDGKKGKLESLLASCWHELEGSSEGGMDGSKLRGRTEALSWDPPELEFSIERHGGTAQGSVYAEVQGWSVDVDKAVARGGTVGRRIVGKRNPPLDVKPLVEEVVALVAAGKKDDPRLKWLDDDRVRINIGLIISSDFAVKQTLQNRRRRFANELEKQIDGLGWEKEPHTSPHTYRRCNDAS